MIGFIIGLFIGDTAEDSSQVLPNIKAALKENGLENQFSELFEMRDVYKRQA